MLLICFGDVFPYQLFSNQYGSQFPMEYYSGVEVAAIGAGMPSNHHFNVLTLLHSPCNSIRTFINQTIGDEKSWLSIKSIT